MENFKKLGRKLKELSCNDIVCLVLLIAAVSYTLSFMMLSIKGLHTLKTESGLSTSPFNISMTNIGRNRQYSPWYYLWAVLINLAFFCNALRMFKRAELTGKFLRAGQILVIAAVVVLFATNWIIEPRSGIKEDNPVGFVLHSFFAIFYTVLSLATFLPVFFSKLKDKRYLALNCVFVPLLVVTVPLLAVFRAVAFNEVYPMVLGFLLMGVINFAKPFETNGEKYTINRSARLPVQEPSYEEVAATLEEEE
jgi:hypothetical protein